MKIRSGFVSNSSSSSFICDFCKEEISGWDMCPTYHCVNGHQSCEDCRPDTNNLSDDEKINEVVSYYQHLIAAYSGYSWMTEDKKQREIKELQEKLESASPDSYDDIDWEEYPATTCPICRLEIYDESEMCLYLYKKYGISRDEIFVRVKAQNKRRRKLHDSEYIQIVCQDNSVTVDKVLEDIRVRFGTWDKYNEFLSEP